MLAINSWPLGFMSGWYRLARRKYAALNSARGMDATSTPSRRKSANASCSVIFDAPSRTRVHPSGRAPLTLKQSLRPRGVSTFSLRQCQSRSPKAIPVARSKLGGEAAHERAIAFLEARLAEETRTPWHNPADFLIRVLKAGRKSD